MVELLESVGQMQRVEVRVVYSPVIQARAKAVLSRAQFAELLGVSGRILQSWAQDRKQTSGASSM